MTQVQEHAPTVSELFGEEEEEEFSEEEEDEEEGEEGEDEFEEYEEGDSQNSNNSSFSAHSDGEKKDFNYTQDRLDAARRKLKEKYGELKAQKDKRTIVTLPDAPVKRRRTTIATYQAPPPTLTKAAPPSNVKSKTSPPLSASPSVCT